jgi:GNAT superfamily N-acetyltransferase
MITTRFLTISEYSTYGDWLKSQDLETLNTYFGFAVNSEYVDRLVKTIVDNPVAHHFLVAENNGVRVGVIHIAEFAIDEVEFGVTVAKDQRKQGIADRMLSEAILWCRNRGYQSLYMHCVTWNIPIKRLCMKHSLIVKSEHGESETKMTLPPPDLISLGQEIIVRQKNMYNLLLQKNLQMLHELYC